MSAAHYCPPDTCVSYRLRTVATVRNPTTSAQHGATPVSRTGHQRSQQQIGHKITSRINRTPPEGGEAA